MELEMLLYQKLDKYGNELCLVSWAELKRDMEELYLRINVIPGLESIGKKMMNFISLRQFSKDDIAEAILQVIRKLESQY